MNPGIQATWKLTHLGYRFTVVDSNTIRAKYFGPGDPDPAQVRPLLEVVKAHKPEVLSYLSENEEVATCDCGAPAWGTDADGKMKCWCCLALPGLFPH
jgi:hypothetical protein